MELELSVPPDPAEPLEVSGTGDDLQRFVTFYIGETLYAIPAVLVAEVGPMLSPTTLPDSPLFVPGISSHRGDLIAVIDLRSGVGELSTCQSPKIRSLVLRSFDAENMAVGFNVDRVSDLRSASIRSVAISENGLPIIKTFENENARLIGSAFLDALLTKTLEN